MSHQHSSHTITAESKVPSIFATHVFTDQIMGQKIPKSIHQRFLRSLKENKPIDSDVCEVYAMALKAWAVEMGATHWTHCFQPLSNVMATKQDAFIKPVGIHSQQIVMNFTASTLKRGEADASSFPNGGLRDTHCARGYTQWDPVVAPFVYENSEIRALYVPSIFFSHLGQSLDKRIPLLRAQQALQTQALRLLSEMGEKNHTEVFMNSGVEQEFFLIDRNLYLKRPDLLTCGRTLIGAPPTRGQDLQDKYLGKLPPRMFACIDDMDQRLWKLGIPVATRHSEVAPGQYELAPIFERSSQACLHNSIMMQVMKDTALDHDLVVLFHEKPFAHLNGSGKHNNFSVGTDLIPNLFEPAADPLSDLRSLTFLTAVIRAVSLHGDLLRYAVSGASNDHRLGGHEAPPGIFACYLGETLNEAVESLIEGKDAKCKTPDLDIDIGVGYLPRVQKESSDRNRTSPMAFTGNRFELRASGASQSPEDSSFILCALLADSLGHIADRLKAAGPSKLKDVLRDVLREHKRAINNGDNYSPSWVQESQKLGLFNLKNTVEALDALSAPKNAKLMESNKILTAEELKLYQDVAYDNYSSTVIIESRTMVDMISASILPSCFTYLRTLGESVAHSTNILGKNDPSITVHTGHYKRVADGISALIASLSDLEEKLATAEEKGMKAQRVKRAHHCLDKLVPACEAVRVASDRLEKLIPRQNWPLPVYSEMLIHMQE